MARWTVDHYNDLREAVATGASEIWFKDKKIRYHGLASMKQLLAEMERELGLTASAPRPRTTTPRFDRGL